MIEVRNDKIYIDDTPAAALAEKYGTPLIAYSEEFIRARCKELKHSWSDIYPKNRAAYASKAFLTSAICKIIESEGLSLDVVSGGELYTAIKSGFPMERVEFNGNNKTEEELTMAIKHDVGRIIIDGTDEACLIENICESLDKKVKVLIRISPGVDSHTHKFITTGNVDSKFGIPLDKEIFEDCFDFINNSDRMELLGFHFHIGSQLHENDSYIMALDILFDIMEKLKYSKNFIPSELNVGGGFGIRYTDEDDEKPYSYFLDPIMEKISIRCDSMGIDIPAIVIEPGRSIVANAAATLYRVGTIKNIPGVRKYVSVDGGMTDNIRPALYDASYECFIENMNRGSSLTSEAVSSGSSVREKVTICGKCCESGDVLIKDAIVNSPKRGDLVAVFSTGAYCYAMSSNYNSIPRPAVVMVSGNESREIIRRQTYEDILSTAVMI